MKHCRILQTWSLEGAGWCGPRKLWGWKRKTQANNEGAGRIHFETLSENDVTEPCVGWAGHLSRFAENGHTHTHTRSPFLAKLRQHFLRTLEEVKEILERIDLSDTLEESTDWRDKMRWWDVQLLGNTIYLEVWFIYFIFNYITRFYIISYHIVSYHIVSYHIL